MWPKDNLESWKEVRAFIDEFPDDDYWSKWKPMAREVIGGLETCGLARLFRIGQGMHHILLSTLEHHGLQGEPRVTLEFNPREDVVRVAYGYTNLYFGEPDAEERVAPAVAVSCILRYLRRLWIETKPGSPLPDELAAA